HHTMFEMLGNWSFGDYFKKEAIQWSWELFTEIYKIDKSKLYVTVFQGDEKDGTTFDKEAYEFWENLISKDRILKFGKKDNFWEMGTQGPCGPSSEIHIDLRNDEEIHKIPGKDLVNKDHPQVVELWNLVFMEFNRNSDGSLVPLKNKHVDTGMGLERLAMVLQGKNSNYDTDIFKPIIDSLESISNKKYLSSNLDDSQIKVNIAFRVIADHLRAVTFSITDGQLPSNNGAGYVIRRILRRAIRYGFQFLDLKEPFIYQLVPSLVNNFDGVFQEIRIQEDFIKKIIQEEEISFFRTLSSGIKRMAEIVKSQKKQLKNTVSGQLAFELYDRYGFPLDLTQLIASENKLKIDIVEFEKCLNEQKNRSKIDAVTQYGDWIVLKQDDVQEFVGYDHSNAKIIITKYRSLVVKGKTKFQLIFNLTPFYPEGGGQVGDTGFIEDNQGMVQIKDTKKENGVIVHYVDELPKNLNSSFHGQVDLERRTKISKNHSATHLLHHALREVLGNHVEQKGSLVTENYLRFDFSHFSKLNPKELDLIEQQVNKQIREANSLIEERNIPIEIAKQKGAIMLFGEKYGDSVRVIQFGNSIELCGGIHVSNSANIGNFKISSESSISSGIRRIEALCDEKADEVISNKLNEYEAISKLLKHPQELLSAVELLLSNNQSLQKKLDSYNLLRLKEVKKQLLSTKKELDSFSIIENQLDISAEEMKQIIFEIKAEMKSLVVLLSTKQNNKPFISLMISEDLVKSKNWNAGLIIRELAKEIKGGGGGQPFFATAGGSDVNGLKNVTLKAREIFK
ncbi:MAG: alanine--tRNA ligase, partial [Flavobacteriales bacterium]|nr:alanine--tRNA ligase [Flavobacteriales bacterium]